ncbi:MAG: ABC transporter substrate-binding protein [Roseovarius sp.]
MSQNSFAQFLSVSGRLPRLDQMSSTPVRIGFLAPLSGVAEGWGRPGLNGCRIWVDQVNAAGGLRIGAERRRVELLPYDCGDDPERAQAGAAQLVDEGAAQLILTLGGAGPRAALPFLNARRVLTSTLLPSDLSPDTPYLIAPSEVHPVYAVTGVSYLCRGRAPRRVALCAQVDAMGLPSLATYRAAFAAEGAAVTAEVQYPAAGGDARAIVAAMMADNPDLLCWCTSYPPMVQALTEAAFAAGFSGQILSCTFDNYARLIARTSAEFMEGVTFQFPDFDDPALADKAFFFNRPKAFYTEYNARYPGDWSAVSWEYAAILDIWGEAVTHAASTASGAVMASLKQKGQVMHAFGEAEWWGRGLFGVDNALVGDWPVVQIRRGKARIVSFESVPAWLSRHEAGLRREMEALGQMWYQRRAGLEALVAR